MASVYLRIRRAAISVAAVGGLIALYRLVFTVNNTTVALSMLLVVLAVSARWGLPEAILASVAAALGFNYFFLEVAFARIVCVTCHERPIAT